jgi:hypothetical protein
MSGYTSKYWTQSKSPTRTQRIVFYALSPGFWSIALLMAILYAAVAAWDVLVDAARVWRNP